MSDNELRELIAELAKKQDAAMSDLRETIKANAEQQKITDTQVKETAAQVKATEQMLGGLSGRIGVIIELIVAPGICAEINKHGHKFEYVAPNMNIRKDKLQTQVDVMLYNTTEAMAVEIKTRLKQDDVIWHLDRRMPKLRGMETEFNIKDKMLYGAVAGITVDDDAREYALQKGLYVIEIRENEKVVLKIDAPEECKIQKW